MTATPPVLVSDIAEGLSALMTGNKVTGNGVAIEQAMIFSSEAYKVDFFSAGVNSTQVVVSFTERGGGTLDGQGFGGRFLLGNGIDVIAVKTSVDHWYQDFSTTALDAIVAFLIALPIRHTIRAGYGSSMGGFAAIKFARRLGLDSVFAISPQVDIAAPWDLRWKNEADGSSFDIPIRQADISDTTTINIAFDPYDLDGLHVDTLAQIVSPERLVIVKVPFSGHPAGYLLNAADCLGSMALEAFRGRISGNYRAKIRASRGTSPEYLAQLSRKAQIAKKRRWALALAERSLSYDRLNPEHIILASQNAEATGDLIAAVTYSALASTLVPTNPYILATAARHLEKLGRIKEALHLISRASALVPGDILFKSDSDRLSLATQ